MEEILSKSLKNLQIDVLGTSNLYLKDVNGFVELISSSLAIRVKNYTNMND